MEKSLGTKTSRKYRILHETKKRLRLGAKQLSHPDLDVQYLQATFSTLPGVTSCRINQKCACIIVEYDGVLENKSRILAYMDNFPAEAFQKSSHENKDIKLPEIVGQSIIALTTPWQGGKTKQFLSWSLGLPVITHGLSTLFNKGIKVEVLDASAIIFSLLRRDYTTSNFIVALLGIGNYLEQWTEEQSDNLLKALLKPQIDQVWVERNALEVSIPFSELKIDDIVICGTGELLPIDGIVIDGEAALNQSSITGESLPRHVREGDEVLSGAIVEDGRLRIVAKNVGQETSMARINRFLENSLRNPSQSQKQSAKLADRLVPITFGLGVLLFALTKDIRRAASVLTVDYSCAIKLAAPIAVKSGMYTAGQSGVLLKGGQAFEKLSQINTFVFDKTGTLTKGELEIVDIIPLQNSHDTLDQQTLLAITASAEEHYGHPVAKAIGAEAKKRNLILPEVSQVDFIVAHGVSAFINDEQVLVGSRHFLEEDEKIDCSTADKYDAKLRTEGKSILYVAKQGHLVGIITLRDEIREEAIYTLSELKKRGINHIVMLTGDHKDTAKTIASQLEYIDEVYWELKPEDKASILYKMQSDGKSIAFAGDGVNDAPALLSADVGVCMPKGADLARESAQVVLLEDDLRTLITARDIAVQNQKVLKNTFYATVGANSFILLLASLGKINPVSSALLHNCSTIGILAYAAKATKNKS